MTKDKQRLALTHESGSVQFEVDPRNVQMLVHVAGETVGEPDRLMFFFRQPIPMPSSRERTPFLVLYYDLETIGVTDAQREILQGAKRAREEEEDAQPSKAAAGLRGQRVAKRKADFVLRQRDALGDDPAREFKLKAVQSSIGKYVEVLRLMSERAGGPRIKFATLELDSEEAIEIVPDAGTTTATDMPRLYRTSAGDVLVQTSHGGLLRSNPTYMAQNLRYALVVAPAEEDKDGDKPLPADYVEENDPGVELDEPGMVLDDELHFVMVYAQLDKVAVQKQIRVPTKVQLAQMAQFFAQNEVPFAAVCAREEQVLELDAAALIEQTPAAGAGLLAGLPPFKVPNLDSEPDEPDSEVEYEDGVDELRVLEDEARERKQLDDMLKIALVLGDAAAKRRLERFDEGDGTLAELLETLRELELADKVRELYRLRHDSDDEDEYSDDDYSDSDE